MTNSGRITNIEWLRIVAMLAVVLIHIDACYTYTILPATRFAVPFFFMVAGYFLGEQNKKKNWKKYIIRSLILLLSATLLYAAVDFVGSWHSGRNICDRSWGQILMTWIVFNKNPFHYHLWFLSAYLYVIIIGALIDKFNAWKQIYWLIVPLLIARFGIQLLDFPPYITRNFLFIGLPCFLLGSWFRSKQNIFSSHLSQKGIVWICCFILILPFVEDYLLQNAFGIQYGDLFTSYIFAFCLLFAAVYLPQVLQQYLPHQTRDLVLGIYIIHPLVQLIYQHVLSSRALIIYNTWFAPIIVFITSWLICRAVFLLYEILKKKQ